MANPRVSVLLPVFNSERYVGEAIRSVLGQASVDLELVVIDDASTDGTPEILRSWEERDSRVRILTLTENVGASDALNAGLAVARGPYIARQDADDVSRPGRLAAQVAFLDREPDVVLLGTNYVRIDASGRVTSVADHAESPSVLSFLLNFSNSLGVPGQGMFRTEVARAAGGFSREFRLAQGYELWTRLAMRGGVAVLPIIGLEYRVHEESATFLHARQQTATAVEVSRRMLSLTTGRTVTREEAEAVEGRWRGVTSEAVSRLANAVISEAYEAYLRTDPSVADGRRVRAIIAHRFARSAVRLAKRARIGEAAICVRLASSWHPAGVAGVGRDAAAARLARA
jgi:hypothetical protein